MDDELNILPISSYIENIKPILEVPKVHFCFLFSHCKKYSAAATELAEVKSSLKDTEPVGSIISKASSLDQAKAILVFVEAISEKTLRSTVSLTAPRGRGKSAALGLAISAAIAFGYSNIFVTSPR
jgi:N-acetyltransferase 10